MEVVVELQSFVRGGPSHARERVGESVGGGAVRSGAVRGDVGRLVGVVVVRRELRLRRWS